MVTIADVAREAQVSRSTASYALSNKRSVSPEVRRNVKEAAQRLGFTPNAGAKALATSRTMVIGLLAHFLDDEFAPAMLQYIRGVTDNASRLGYDTLLIGEADGVRALERITRSRMVDGVVLLNVADNDERLPILRQVPQPGALIGLPGDCSGVDVFDLDFAAAGRLMVDHLHELGHREALLVSQPEHVVARGGAYVWRLKNAALEQARLHGMRLHTAFGEARQPEIGRTMHRLLDTYPDVTGLLINNEAASAALPSVLHARGKSVPADLSVVGRYSDEFARTFSLPYTSVESAPGLLGSLAVRQLVRRITGTSKEETPWVRRFVHPELVDRASTGPPRCTT